MYLSSLSFSLVLVVFLVLVYVVELVGHNFSGSSDDVFVVVDDQEEGGDLVVAAFEFG